MKNINTPIPKITKNYNIFNFLPFNRKYRVRPDLVDSFRNYGWLSPITCIYTELYGMKKLYIIDGQNRLASAEFLKLPILYNVLDSRLVKCKKDLVSLTAIFNSTSKAWSVSNYVEAFATLDNEHYLYLSHMKDKSNLSYNTLAGIYSGYAQSVAPPTLKNGTFTIKDKNRGDKIISYIADLNKIVKFNNRMSIAFAGFVLSTGLQRFKNKIFIENLRNNLPLLDDAIETTQYKQLFSKVYDGLCVSEL